jgi:PAS domain S-box-containing protein
VETELGRLLDALPGLVWTALPDGRAEYIGRAWLDYTGLAFEDASGFGWISAVHPDDAPRLLKRWAEIIASGEVGVVEARLRRHDGAYRRFLFDARPMPEPSGGEVLRWCGMNFDIDERVRAEEAARAHQHRFERIVDGLPAIAALFSPSGRITFCNRRMLEYLDTTLEEIQAKPSAYNFHPEEREEVLEHWAIALDRGSPFDREVRLQRADGVFRWHRMMVTPLRNSAGEVELWYGLSIDIDDTKRAEAAVHAYQRRFQQIVDDMPAIVALFDPSGPITFSNKQMLEYHGQTLEQLQQGEAGYTFHPEDRPEILRRYGKAMRTGQPFDCEVRLLRHDGGYRHHVVNGFPVRDARGGVELWCGLFTDVDDARQAQAELAAEKSALEQSLADRERAYDFLNQAQRLSHTGSFTFHADPEKQVWSDEMYRILELESGTTVTAAMARAMIHPDDLAKYDAMVERGLAGEQMDATYRIVTPSGAVKYTHTVAHRLAERADGPLFIGATQDVTETKSTEDALRSSERQLRQTNRHFAEAQRLSRTGSFTADVVADDHLWSEELYRIFEFDVGSKISVNDVLRVMHPEDRSRFEAAFGRSVMEGVDFDQVFRIIPTSGNVKHLHFVGRVLEWVDERPVFAGSMQDETEQVLAAEALRTSEAELRAAYSQLAMGQHVSATGSFAWDLTLDQHSWSEETYRIWEFDPRVPLTIDMIVATVHPEDMPKIEIALAGAREGKGFDVVFRIITPKGTLKHIHGVAQRMEQVTDRVVYIGATQDVTESKRAAEALDRTRAELAHVARMATLSALTASIAHEINQPLAGIITNANTCLRMLAADPPNLEGARATAQRTIRDGARASDVIARLRALFSRRAPVRERVDLNEIVREVLALSAAELQRARVTLRADLRGDLPPVMGDRVQLQQVILNLLLNAADAMNEVEDRARELTVSTAPDGDDLARLSVRDAGVGVAPEFAEKLFQPFETTKPTGMGIGLSISRTIVESHGGRLWATANEGGPGATFAFTIPAPADKDPLNDPVEREVLAGHPN